MCVVNYIHSQYDRVVLVSLCDSFLRYTYKICPIFNIKNRCLMSFVMFLEAHWAYLKKQKTNNNNNKQLGLEK